MILSYLKAGRLKQWLGRPDCPAFLQECNALFDKALEQNLRAVLVLLPLLLAVTVRSPV